MFNIAVMLAIGPIVVTAKWLVCFFGVVENVSESFWDLFQKSRASVDEGSDTCLF